MDYDETRYRESIKDLPNIWKLHYSTLMQVLLNGRYFFATHLLETGYDILKFQVFWGHKDASLTMITRMFLNKGGMASVAQSTIYRQRYTVFINRE